MKAKRERPDDMLRSLTAAATELDVQQRRHALCAPTKWADAWKPEKRTVGAVAEELHDRRERSGKTYDILLVDRDGETVVGGTAGGAATGGAGNAGQREAGIAKLAAS